MKYINNLIDELKLDAILLTDSYNIRYISGYKGDTGVLFATKDKGYILTDSRYTEQVTIEAPEFECVDIGMTGYSKTLKGLLSVRNDNGSGTPVSVNPDNNIPCYKVGFEDEHISYKQYKTFCDAFSGVELIPMGGKVNSLRQIKSDAELACIEKAESIGDEAFSHILTFLKPGISEREIALELEYTMKRLGASGLSFDTIAASGPHSSLPHAVPDDRRLCEGDFLTMDFGCVYNGYCSDMTRTIFIGSAPTKKQLEVYNTVLHAQTESMKLIKPGAKCSDVDACARSIIADAGYGDYFGHGLGHSVGLYIHEEPRLSRKCDDILKPGMTMTVEPGIYLPGEFGVRIEDLVVVTETGYRNLTASDKELIMIK